MSRFAPVLAAVTALSGCAAESLPGGGRAEECGQCHVAEYDAWSASRMAAGSDGEGTSPVFKAMLPGVEEAWGKVARARCVSCHQPGFAGDEGIGCVACHSAVGNRGVGNGAVVIDLGAPIGATRAANSAPAHGTEARDYLASNEMCGTCHVVHGPGLFEEDTLGELLAASTEKTCRDCHLRPRGGAADHRFTGVDPRWGASEEERAAATSESVALIAEALSLSVVPATGGFEVRLTNTGAGHAVPSGVAFLRDFWVDVRITDAGGAVFEMPRVIELGGGLTRSGEPVSLPTQADTIHPRVLVFGETAAANGAAPEGASAPVKVEATLRVRAVRADLLVALGLEDRAAEVPEMTITSASLVVP